MNHKPCSHCGGTNHLSIRCFNKKNKAITKQGKHAKLWMETRNEWLQKNASPTGWNCYICNVKLDRYSLTLDHIKSRSRYPELRYDLDNLAPCCWLDNVRKGSRSLDNIFN